MILALLVFQTTELPDRLAKLSPWIDMVVRGKSEVFADLAAQRHRRFVKTHTPLDGIPDDPRITYVVVGRDPRDVAISMDNHVANMDIEVFLADRAAAAEVDGIELEPLSASARRRRPTRSSASGAGSTRTLIPGPRPSPWRSPSRHLRSFWNAPDDLDVVWLHYDDLLADLGGEMRRVADRLGIDVPEGRWPALVEAATLDSMRAQAARTVPGRRLEFWKDPDRFFHKGTSGQWRELLDDEGVDRYADRVRSLAPPELVDWLHHADPLPA